MHVITSRHLTVNPTFSMGAMGSGRGYRKRLSVGNLFWRLCKAAGISTEMALFAQSKRP